MSAHTGSTVRVERELAAAIAASWVAGAEPTPLDVAAARRVLLKKTSARSGHSPAGPCTSRLPVGARSQRCRNASGPTA